MEKPIRVLVANRPRLMRELTLAMLEDQPDIKVVGEVANEIDIPELIARTLPDFVVIALEEPGKRPRICDTVLRQHPGVRIIALASDHNYSVYYWASSEIHSSDLETSEEGVLSAIRHGTNWVGGQA